MIPIRNIYYMLSYAFSILQEKEYKKLSSEQFKNTADLFAAIMVIGVSRQIKRGLNREYIPVTDSLAAPKGKFDVSASLRDGSLLKHRIVCTYDEFTVNSTMNRVLKTTMHRLLHEDITKERRNELKKQLLYFSEVQTIDLRTVDWHFRYDRNNQTYRMLMAICQLTYKGLLQSNRSGSMKMATFLDEKRECALYERFLREYYRKHYKELLSADAVKIDWQVDDGFKDLLPDMKTDITLSDGKGNILIMDAKYYAHETQQQFDTHKLHSNNLYQIFTYVKNKEWEMRSAPNHKVSGMLLYAKTDEVFQIRHPHSYQMSGNRITVQTLDLNCDFEEIRKQLDKIVEDHFGVIS